MKTSSEMINTALANKIFDKDDFKCLTLQSDRDKITIISVKDGYFSLIKGQMSTDIPESEILDEVNRLFQTGFNHIICELYSGRVNIDLSPKGHVKISYTKSQPDSDIDHLIDSEEIGRLLEAIEVADSEGYIKTDMIRKLGQVENFIRIIEPIVRKSSEKTKIFILDCAAGKSYLSYVMNYFIREKMRRSCHFFCIDTNASLIEKCIRISRELRYNNMEFHVSQILDFIPDQHIDILCSLHACDTATDEAIAKGINLNSEFLLIVPCCQHEVINQLKDHPLKAITGHGVYKAKLADLLTDAMRTLILESAGYKVSVIEFVSPIYTPKNIMIQAEKVQSRNKMALEQYLEIKRAFNIEISLEKMVPGIFES
jgi:hypothetical protein